MSQSSLENPIALTVSKANSGQRLDKFLCQELSGFSRSQLKQLIQQGQVSVSPATEKKIRGSLLVQEGQEWSLSIPPPSPSDLIPEDLPLDVLYEDAHLILVNKAPGMVVHPGAGHATGTLVNGLRFRYPDIQIGSSLRPGLVHRIDKETSGVLVIARTEIAHRELSDAFAQRQVQKEYSVFCYGRPKEETFSLKTGHKRHETDRRRFTTRLEPPANEEVGIRFAHTDFRVCASAQGVSWLEARLHTGRTHQIRAQLADFGYPLVMDSIYGGLKPEKRIGPGAVQRAAKNLGRHALHAARISFNHPKTKEKFSCGAPLPGDLQLLKSAILDANSI